MHEAVLSGSDGTGSLWVATSKSPLLPPVVHFSNSGEVSSLSEFQCSDFKRKDRTNKTEVMSKRQTFLFALVLSHGDFNPRDIEEAGNRPTVL